MAMSITVGIPFYNAEAYLTDAIRSIFAQTYHDWELLLVDDGSTDRSLEIAHSVDDPRVRVISDGQNRRLPYRLNQITAEATFDLVARMDADDLVSPNRFQEQIRILNDNPEVDLVTTGICSITNDTRPVGVRCGLPSVSISARNLLLGRCQITHAAILGRRSWFLRNPYDVSQFTGDFALWIKAFSKGDFKIHIIHEPLYYYREESNVTSRKLLAEYADQRRMYKEFGHMGFSGWEIPLMTARSLCKTSIAKLLSIAGKTSLLLSRRNTPIEEMRLRARFDSEIRAISQTRIPGIDN
jgi:glycosyltransferase involved in cell wall biosynthesis